MERDLGAPEKGTTGQMVRGHVGDATAVRPSRFRWSVGDRFRRTSLLSSVWPTAKTRIIRREIVDKIRRIQLYFDTFKEGLHAQHPKPFFFVCLGIESRVNFKNIKGDPPLNLTPVEYHPHQTEVQIDSLIKELEEVKKELWRKWRSFEKRNA